MRIHHPRAVAVMRRINLKNLPFTASCQKLISVDVGAGNRLTQWVEQFELDCRLAPSDVGASPNERSVGDLAKSMVRWFVFFAWDAPDIPPDWRIVITGKDSSSSQEWTKIVNVLAYMESRDNRVETKVLCLEVR